MAHLRKLLFLNCGAWFSGLVISLIKTPTGRHFPLGQFVLRSPFKFETSMIFHIFWWWLLNGTCWYLCLLLMTGIRLEIKQTQVIPRHTDSNSKVHGAYRGPTWGRQDPGGSHVGLMNFAIWGNFPIHSQPHQSRVRVPTDKVWKISMIFQWYFQTKVSNFHDNYECFKTEKHMITYYT